MHNPLVRPFKTVWSGKLVGGTALILSASAMSCTHPGYRTEVYPGQQGQYQLERVPEAPRPEDSSAQVQAEAARQAPAPADENLNQVEAIWPKLSDSDKALLVETAKHLAAQK
jgi:hypothetical protein